MLHLLDETLAAFLREVVPLPARDVDIAFEAPDGEWSVGRSTLNLHLWDVRPHPATVAEADGRRFGRTPPPRVDCRYLVTAWAGAVRDEHALLGEVLTTLLRHPEIGAEHLRGGLASGRPLPELRLRGGDGPVPGGLPKPGLDLVVTVTVDAAPRVSAARPIERVLIRAEEIAAMPDPAENPGRLPGRRWSGRD